MSALDRRTFVRTAAAAAAAGLTFDGRPLAAAAPRTHRLRPIASVRVGFVGVGHQGSSHVANFLRIDGVEIRAICDLLPEHVAAMQDEVEKAGHPRPTGYVGREEFRRMCDAEDLDLVFNATPWEMHAPVLLAAMNAGKHAVTEVPMAVTVDECWELVEASEKTGRHCVMMENCCYDRTEMMILNMVRQGLFGDLTHAECGYLHDLRELKLTDYYVERWRIAHSIRRNGDLYPTHGLGPVAQWMNVNRGNRFDYVVAMASPGGGLNAWAAEHIGPSSAEATQRYALGDVVNTLIRTLGGQTILLTHDTNSPRPYSRRIVLQGKNGVVRKYPEEKIHIEGRSPRHQWEALADYRTEYEHPLWRTLEEKSRGAGHGGMDYIEDYRLVRCLQRGEPLDMDVYDGAALTAMSQLSERSIADRSRPQDVPDFTRGAFLTREPIGIVEEDAIAGS